MAAGLGLGLGCVSGQSEEQREVSPEPSEAVASVEARCAPLSEDAIASLPAGAGERAHPCGVALELREGQLLVRARGREGEGEGAVLARGVGPEACGDALRGCELWAVLDRLGPLVFASQRGHESEIPTQVHLGFVDAERLVFVETWYGLPSVSDHTRIGPAWVLAPFDCEGELHLLPAPRLVEATDEPVDETVQALAGRWRVGDDGAALAPSEASPRDPDRCRAIVAPH